MGSSNGISLEEAKYAYKMALVEGKRCPCCGRWGKIDGRRINVTMARGLIWLVRTWSKGTGLRGGWVHVPSTGPRWLTKSNQHPTLRWWGLVERKPSDDPKQKSQGMWRPTSLGFKFANGRVFVPSTVYTYDNRVLGYSRDRWSVWDALGEQFDYERAMLPAPVQVVDVKEGDGTWVVFEAMPDELDGWGVEGVEGGDEVEDAEYIDAEVVEDPEMVDPNPERVGLLPE